MGSVTLFIGSKNLSSWSLRPWLLLRHHGVEFKEVVIPLDQPDTRRRILEHSPTGRVPALLHGRVTIWESLAICEYAAETFALPGAWPLDPDARAFARSVAHEMHSGYPDLRRELPFDATRKPKAIDVSEAARADIERVLTIWREARSRFGWRGEWLMGHFGIVDAMFAPVALRFDAYGVKLDRTDRDYVDSVRAHPAIAQWIEAAAKEAPAAATPARTTAVAPEPAIRSVAIVDRTPKAVAVPAKPATPPPPPPERPAARPEPAAPPKAAAPAPAKAPVTFDSDIDEDEMPPTPQRAAPTAPGGKKGPAEEKPQPRVRSTILPPD